MLLEVGDIRPLREGESVTILNYIFLKIEDNLISASNRITDKVMLKRRYASRTSRQKIYNDARRALLADYAPNTEKWYGINITDGYTSGKLKLMISVIDSNRLNNLCNMSALNIDQDLEDRVFDTLTNTNRECSSIIDANRDIAFVKVENLDLSVRSINGLRAAGIDTIGELAKLGVKGLSRIRGLGINSIIEIAMKMKDIGIDINLT